MLGGVTSCNRKIDPFRKRRTERRQLTVSPCRSEFLNPGNWTTSSKNKNKIKMEVPSLAVFDDHICVYCRRKISGLNNYIEHLKVCEPTELFGTKSIPRLPLLRTPSRESVQSDLQLELDSLAESRCSSPDSYMQRIYNDMERYEKEVLGCDSVAEIACREESKSDHSLKEDGDKCSVSTRFPAVSHQSLVCVDDSIVGRNFSEGLLEKLKDLNMGLASPSSGKTVTDSVSREEKKCDQNMSNELRSSSSLAISEKIAVNPNDPTLSSCDGKALQESNLSVSSPGDKTAERMSRNLCVTAKYLLGSCSHKKKMFSRIWFGQDCLNNVTDESKQTVNDRYPLVNVAPSAVFDSSSSDQKLEGKQNIVVPTKQVNVDPNVGDSSLSSGFTKSTHRILKVYQVWGNSSETLATSMRNCLLEIFCMLESLDKKKVLDEIERLCSCYVSDGGKIQIKFIQATNKINLFIKKMDDEQDNDDRLRDERTATELLMKEKENDSNAAGENLAKVMTSLPECGVECISEESERITTELVNDTLGEGIVRKEIAPTAAPGSPVDESVCKPSVGDSTRQEEFEKTVVDTTILPADVSMLKVSSECVAKPRNISPKLDSQSPLKDSSCGDVVDTSPRHYGAKEVGDPLLNTEIFTRVSNPHISSKVLPDSPRKCVVKGAVLFKGLPNSLKSAVFEGADDNCLKISKDIEDDCSTNKAFMEAKNNPDASIVSQENNKQTKDTPVGGKSKDPCELNNSQHRSSFPSQMGKQLKSSMVCIPLHSVVGNVFFSSLEDVGLEVEVGPNETSSFVSDDCPMKEDSTLLTPSENIETETVAGVAKESSGKRGCGNSQDQGKRKPQSVNEINVMSPGEMPIQEGNEGRPRKRGRPKNSRGSSRTLHNRKVDKGETGLDSVKLDRTTRLGLQRYHLRVKPVEGCSTVVSSKVREDTLPTLDLGAKLSQSELLDSQVCSRKVPPRRGSKFIESMSMAKDEIPAQENGNAQTAIPQKETSLDPVTNSDDSTCSKCVEGQLGTASILNSVTTKEIENIPGWRGFKGSEKKKSYHKKRNGIVVKKVPKYVIRRHKKLKILVSRVKMHLRSRGAHRRYTNRSPIPLLRFIRTQSGYSLRTKVSQQVDANVSLASKCKSSEEGVDLQQKRPNAPCPVIKLNEKTPPGPVQKRHGNVPMRMHRSRRNSLKRKRKQAENDVTNVADSASYTQDQDGGECRRNASDDIKLNASIKSCGLNSKAKSVLHNKALEMKSSRNAVIVRYPVIRQNEGLQTMHSSSPSPTEQSYIKKGKVAVDECRLDDINRSRLVIESVKLNQDDKKGLELIKKLKPFSIDLGYRCDSKEFLSQLSRKDFVITSINVKQEDRTSPSLRKNWKESTRSELSWTTTGCQSLGSHKCKRRKIRSVTESSSMPVLIQELPDPKVSSDSIKKNSENAKEKILNEVMPVLIPEMSSKQKVNDSKISYGSVTTASPAPREVEDVTEDDKDGRNPVKISSSFMEDDEVQIILEFINPKKSRLQQLQAHMDSLKGCRKAVSIAESEELVAESFRARLPCCKSLSPDKSNHANRDVEGMVTMSPNKVVTENSACLETINRTAVPMVNKTKELEKGIYYSEGLGGKLCLHKSIAESGISNILIKDVRSGAELTEEEGNIFPSLEGAKSKKIMGQTYKYIEQSELLAGEEVKMNGVNLNCEEDDDLICLSSEKVLLNAPSVDKSIMNRSKVPESAQEDVVLLEGDDRYLPDIDMVHSANLSHGDTTSKDSESTLWKYLDSKGRHNEASLSRPPRLAFGREECVEECIWVEKVIPLITLSDATNVGQTTKLPKGSASESFQSHPVEHHSEKSKVTKQLFCDCKRHEIQGKESFGGNASAHLYRFHGFCSQDPHI